MLLSTLKNYWIPTSTDRPQHTPPILQRNEHNTTTMSTRPCLFLDSTLMTEIWDSSTGKESSLNRAMSLTFSIYRFAVHGVSVNKTNRLVNGDNKGYASYSVEKNKLFTNTSVSTSSDPFVAAFAQSNEGDVSPHTFGFFCTGTDQPCDGTKSSKCPWRSTCQGR